MGLIRGEQVGESISCRKSKQLKPLRATVCLSVAAIAPITTGSLPGSSPGVRSGVTDRSQGKDLAGNGYILGRSPRREKRVHVRPFHQGL